MSIYLIRHGESEHNIDLAIMEHIHDSEHHLTELGEKQAEATADFLKNLVTRDTVIYSSPYKRTMQTAEAIQSKLPENVPIYENPLIREWELGNLLNISNRTPQLKKEYKSAGHFYYRYPNGESMADVYLRATIFSSTFLQRIRDQKRYEDVLIVTHSAFMQAFLTFMMQWPIDNNAKHQPFDNASVIAIDEINGDYKYEKIYAPKIRITN
ncbi:histidine phosphatase family protein [Oceanobacillus longus]|uniref:Histidine phosphatase family protein n=1 Tax=Oceanobacillus longus TaxID=930120 RepID=A0ABV8GZP3_9BACI